MSELGDSSFRGQGRILSMSTIAFTVCFAVWTIFAIIGVRIQQDLGLSETQFGLLVGTPILTGSLSRIFLGIWADQYGGRIVYVAVMILSAIATFLLSLADTYGMILLAALGVGLAGGSFAVGITYVSKWYPSEKQGTALGIFGMGNVGTAVTVSVAPFVMVAFGWEMVAEVWAAALVVMAVVFWFTTEDDPELKARREQDSKPPSILFLLEPLKKIQVWRFSLYYFFVLAPPWHWRCGCRAISSASMASTSRPRAFSQPSTRSRQACSVSMAATCPTDMARGGSCIGLWESPCCAPFCCPIRKPIM